MIYRILASVAYLFLLAGWAQRRHRARHVPLVLAGIGLDLALVLILELSRDVIGLTMTKHYGWAQWTHIGSSVLAVALYVPVVWYGVALLRGRAAPAARAAHRRLAEAALLCRTIGFVFMWSLQVAA